MSFRRLREKPGDLNVRLVADGEDPMGVAPGSSEVSSASSSTGAIVASAAEPALVGNLAKSLSRALGGSASRASGSRPGSSSRNSASGSGSRSSFHGSGSRATGGGGGGSRDMELVDIVPFDGASPSARLPTDPSARRARRSSEEDGEGEGDREAVVNEPRPRPVWPSVLADGWKAYWLRSLHAIFLSTKFNFLLFAIPIAIGCKIAGAGDGPLFIFALIGLCPLAERISFVTDEMAKYTNDSIGGLLSASFGNVTEMIVSFFALQKGLLRVVQLSLLGSVYSNLLLVQGMAFFVGGLKYSQQKYSQQAAKTNVSLLLLAVMGISFPMILISSGSLSAATAGDSTAVTESLEGITAANELALSRLASVLMLIVYGLLILYQLKTHAHLFEGDGEDEDDEDDPPVLGPWGSIAWACVVTLFISILSEFIVSAIDGAAESIGLPVLFSATILLPLVGNAAEHASALVFARRDQMDIALGISVGSSTQISLFVIPLLVVLGWMIGQPLSLDFQVFETGALLLTVVMSSVILSTGKSDWLYGVMMIVAYIIIAGAFWLQKQPKDLK